MVWQCRRTAPLCEEIKADSELSEYIQAHTGLLADAYFSGTKLKWILDHVEGARERAERGEFLFGTVDSWLVWKLTGGKAHVTDYTNASRTMLFDIRKLCWDERLCAALDVPMAMLPRVMPSSAVYGTANLQGVEVPIAGIAGDQQAALFGQTCFGPRGGQEHLRYRLLPADEHRGPPVPQPQRPGDHPGRRDGGAPPLCPGGLRLCGGRGDPVAAGRAALPQRGPGRRILRLQGARQPAGSIWCPPSPAWGLPIGDMYARGALVGITRGTSREHIIRAAQESIAYQVADLVEAMEKDTGLALSALNADGGASRDRFLMQFQADILGIPVNRPAIRETTALGAAYLAGLAVGMWRRAGGDPGPAHRRAALPARHGPGPGGRSLLAGLAQGGGPQSGTWADPTEEGRVLQDIYIPTLLFWENGTAGTAAAARPAFLSGPSGRRGRRGREAPPPRLEAELWRGR